MKRKLSDNLKRVEQRIEEACQRADRNPADVKLVAVTKYVGHDVIRALAELGISCLGESRPQELIRRASMLHEWLGRRAGIRSGSPPPPEWHMIGHLQRNKVKALLPWVSLVHSVDSLRLAEEINTQSGKLGRVMPILIEVNAGGEGSKQGLAVAATTHFIEQIATLEHLSVRGLMTMAPLTEDESIIRHVFGRARELFEEVASAKYAGPAFRELSMGMSGDFEMGIEAGATLIRVGSALFEGLERSPEPACSD